MAEGRITTINNNMSSALAGIMIENMEENMMKGNRNDVNTNDDTHHTHRGSTDSHDANTELRKDPVIVVVVKLTSCKTLFRSL